MSRVWPLLLLSTVLGCGAWAVLDGRVGWIRGTIAFLLFSAAIDAWDVAVEKVGR